VLLNEETDKNLAINPFIVTLYYIKDL